MSGVHIFFQNFKISNKTSNITFNQKAMLKQKNSIVI